MTTSQAKTSRTYHHGDLREALVGAATRIVEENGPDEISLRGVAKAAGVSRAAPYHHFKDKKALLAAVAAKGFRELAASMLTAVDPDCPPRDRLDQLGQGYVAYGLAHPQMFRLMQGPAFQLPGTYPDLDAARQESATPLIETVSACLPGAAEADIMAACAAAWSIVHGMATLSVDGRLQSLIGIDPLEPAARTITSQLQLLGKP